MPTYYKSRVYIDLSDNEQYGKNFEQLLRWVFDKPLYVKPELGPKPGFLEETTSISLGTGSRFSRAIEAVRNSRPYAIGALREYFDTFTTNLENFRIISTETGFDDRIVENIGLFLPYRNEVVQLFGALAQYGNTNDTLTQLHLFFERLIPYLSRPESVQTWREVDFDNFKFIVHELFLYCIAVLLKHQAFNAVGILLGDGYYLENNPDYGKNNMENYVVFRQYLKSIEHRNARLKLRRLSLHADLLKERSVGSGVGFEQLMQADFVLFIRSSIEALTERGSDQWWPETMVYKVHKERPFEIFARAESTRYFGSLLGVLGISKKDELVPMFEAFQAGKLYVPHWEGWAVSPLILMNFDKLASRK